MPIPVTPDALDLPRARQTAVYVYQTPVRVWHWVNALSLNALHHVREEMLPFGVSMMQGVEQFKRLADAVGTGRIALIEAEEEGRNGRRGVAKLRETEVFLAELRSALTGGTDPVPLSAEFFARRGSRRPCRSDQEAAAPPAA